MTNITLPYNFEARDYQKPFFRYMNNGGKRAVLVWNRRAGKDTSAWNFLIYKAIKTKGIYYYIFPTFAQGRKVLWDGMTMGGYKFLDFIPKDLISNKNSTEMKIRLVNGSLIQIIGSDKYDALMGTNPAGCIFSEYSLQNPNAWQYIRPILDANDGWAIFIFTPRGSNHAKEIYDMALANDEWFAQLLTVDDTKTLSKEELNKIRKEGVSEDMIQQEWYCSFTLGIQGSYYANYLQAARDDKRISRVPHDSSARVNTAWDLGHSDHTSIVFYQIVGNEIHIIDFYENHHQELSHYVKLVLDKNYIYDKHYAPHDANSQHLASNFSVAGRARALGIEFRVLPTINISLLDGIEQCRIVFPRIWIDEQKCAGLIRALENYRSEIDEVRHVFKNKPVHDKYSHASDAFRYMAIAVKLYVDQEKVGPTDDFVEQMLNKYQPKFQ